MTTLRNLGGLQVPAIGFGAMVLSPGMYGEIDAVLARLKPVGATLLQDAR